MDFNASTLGYNEINPFKSLSIELCFGIDIYIYLIIKVAFAAKRIHSNEELSLNLKNELILFIFSHNFNLEF